MSISCNLNNILNDQIYSIYFQSGYRILTNEEYNKEIKSNIRELSKLYADNIIDTPTFTSCVTAITEKFIESELDSIFSLGSSNRYWITLGYGKNEKRARK